MGTSIKRLNRVPRLLAGAVLAATASVGLAAMAAAQDATIGALLPLTGGLQAYGESSRHGIELAVEEVNAAGGVLDGDLELVVGDTQTKAQPAIDAAKKLVSLDGACCLVGALASGNTNPIATTVSAVEQVPQISGASTAPTLTTLEDNDFLFRTVPSDSFQGEVLGRLVHEQEVGSIAIIYVNNDYGQGLAEAFQSSFEAAGGTVTASTAFEPNKESYRGELSSLAGGDAEALLLIAYPDDGGLLILRQALEEGFFDRFVFTDGMKTEQLMTDIGAQYLDGAFGTAPKATESAAGDAFAKAYEAKFGQLPPLPFIDSAYDATMILALAIEKAGTTDGAAVRDAIRQVSNPPGETILPGEFAKAKDLIAAGTDIDYRGAAGDQDFDEHGDVAGSVEHWRVTSDGLQTVAILTD